MIKLIVSDLDGTLLRSDKSLPPKIFPLIARMREKGILFAPCSGRQYESLRRLFEPVQNDVLFVCENGGAVFYRNQLLLAEYLPPDAVEKVVLAMRRLPQCETLLCAPDCAYYERKIIPFSENVKRYYPQNELVDDLLKVAREKKICKIALYAESGAAEAGVESYLNGAVPELLTKISGFDWCDTTGRETNKSVAIDRLCRKLGFLREECMAFGDHMNDLEMLQYCGHSFITANAFGKLKEYGFTVIASNDEEGVLKKIEELLNE